MTAITPALPGYLVTLRDRAGLVVHQYFVCEAHAREDGYAQQAIARGSHTERCRSGETTVRRCTRSASDCEHCEGGAPGR